MRRLLIGLALGLVMLSPVSAQQRTFATPEEAARAVVNAFGSDNRSQIMAIFGPRVKDLIDTTNPEEDRARRQEIAAAAARVSVFEKQKNGSMIWVVGDEVWPFPVPLVPAGKGWRWDTAAGHEEVLKRRVGRNELAAIKMLRALAQAQMTYAATDWDGDGVFEFAQRIMSTPGQHDGLYWKAGPDEDPSPLQGLEQSARTDLHGKTWMGYRFKLLTGQGPQAPGGKFSYLINGNMFIGYAVLAYPADYGKSGIQTFLLNRYGEVREADLGRDTTRIAEKITLYNPGKAWKLVPYSGIY